VAGVVLLVGPSQHARAPAGWWSGAGAGAVVYLVANVGDKLAGYRGMNYRTADTPAAGLERAWKILQNEIADYAVSHLVAIGATALAGAAVGVFVLRWMDGRGALIEIMTETETETDPGEE
jgi:hypothetical protein